MLDSNGVPYQKNVAKFKSQIVHMFDEQVVNTLAKENLDLSNVEIFLGLTCILPLLKCMQSLSKFV
jgi:hypothetical protein